MLVSFSAAQRLPELATPEHYTLIFTPNFTSDSFSGEETIQVRVLKPTREIVLNAAEISFQEVSIRSNGSIQPAAVTLDKEKEMATLSVEHALQPGPASIVIQFTGTLNGDLRGFYLGKDEQGRKYAATQFEATDARRAFPSFDEPAYKATFDITLVADQGLTAISNGKAISDEAGPAGKHTVHFATTAKMSSYLVAMAVGRFEYVEGSAEGVPIRVYSPPGKKELGRFALQASQECLRYFDRYFGIKYPYGKLDLIGLPDFSAGAMENTGLITFREALLLLDENHASVGLKKEVAEIISHEIAHQWFGDLVTMQWWEDIWLNEGFATWMESKPVAAWKPEWNIPLDDVLDTAGTLSEDSLQNTRPIRQPADTPAQIDELFDGIAYGKAAAVLRMLEAYLGPEDFRAGVNAYLKQHSYGNASAADFWSTLATASRKPVDVVMPTFVDQPGAPFIGVKAQCAGNSTQVTLSQKRYFYDRARFAAQSPELWQVPVCLKGGVTGGNSSQQCVLLTKAQQTFDFPGCTSWMFANAGAAGYYRSGYQPDSWQALGRNAESALTPAERILLLSDAWGSVRAGQVSVGTYLSVAENLRGERNRAVVVQLLDRLNYIGKYLVTGADKAAYAAWTRTLLGPIAKEVGWQPRSGESDEQKSLRAHLLRALGGVGEDPEALAEAHRLTEKALQDPASVDPGLAPVALSLSAKSGDTALYDQYVERLKTAKTPDAYYLYFWPLAEFSDPKLVQRTLDFALSPQVRSQDASRLVAYVIRHPQAQELAWDYVRSHWPNLEKLGGGFAAGDVVGATSSFCSLSMHDQVSEFFGSHPVPSAERTLKQSLESIQQCVDLKSQQEGNLASWLHHAGGARNGAAGR
ncbi:MAG: M1 family metallopeptidase [Acidobacteria bacterium]|nr:M1 family metallopeptidase [Acidobacteriota bacterium]